MSQSASLQRSKMESCCFQKLCSFLFIQKRRKTAGRRIRSTRFSMSFFKMFSRHFSFTGHLPHNGNKVTIKKRQTGKILSVKTNFLLQKFVEVITGFGKNLSSSSIKICPPFLLFRGLDLVRINPTIG